MRNTRKEYIDVAKGIAMICIVLGHLGIYDINRVVYTFMVSIFFLITGYFINDKRDIKSFVISKVKRLIIPYLFVSCTIIVFSVIINELFLGGVETKALAKKWIIAALFGTGGSDVQFLGYPIPGIGAIWFLLAMFWGAIWFRLLLETNVMVRMFLVLLISGISVWSAKIVFLPLSIQPGGVALLFIYIGYLIKQIEPYIKKVDLEVKIIFTIIIFFCWIDAIVDYQWFLLVLADIGRGAIDVFKSLCGCYIVILFAKWISKNRMLSKPLEFIGKYSIIFLSVHLLEMNFFPKSIFVNGLIRIGVSEMISIWLVVLFRIWIITCLVYVLSKCSCIRKIFGFPMIVKGEKNE